MPTYRYRCGGCGEEFEVWQSITDDPFRSHDHGCGGELVKVLSPAGIVLKGSGFYKNDSRSGAGTRGGDGKSSGDGQSSGDRKDGEKSPAPKKEGGDSSKSSPSGGDTSSSGSSTASSTTS